MPSIPDVAAAAETTNETGEGGAEAGDHTYKFNIAMSCGGCSGAVDRVLKKLDGLFFLFLGFSPALPLPSH